MVTDRVFKAVADPHRRHLLESLAEADGQTLTKLCAGLPMSRIGVMQHLTVLEQAGLIRTRKVGREKLHYLNAAPLASIAVWLERYPGQWNARMDRLDDLIQRTQANPPAQEPTDAAA